jgi:hypothetical protein
MADLSLSAGERKKGWRTHRQTAEEKAWNQKNHLSVSALKTTTARLHSPPSHERRMIDHQLLYKLYNLLRTLIQCQKANTHHQPIPYHL